MNRLHTPRGHRVRSAALGLALALLTGALLAACGGGSSDDGGGGGGGDVVSNVEFTDNFFVPDTLTFKAGSTVVFKYENTGLAVHNMSVLSQDVEGKNFQSPAAVNPGESGEFEATFTKKGSFKFICVYHMPGMEGTITVN